MGNPSERRRKDRAWRQRNPHGQKCRAAAASANKRYPGRLTSKDVAGIFERCNRTCYWCQRSDLAGLELTLEHLEPVNDIAHIVVACRPCNSARLREGQRDRRRTDAEKLAQQQELERRWQQRHAEKNRARLRKYYEEHKDLVKARTKARATANPDAERERFKSPEMRARGVERARQWRLAHPDRDKALKRASYERQKLKLGKG